VSWRYRIPVAVALLFIVGYGYWQFAIPAHRVAIQSELIMLGDLDDDHRWTASDLRWADHFADDPYGMPDSAVSRLDVNRNGLIDPEDLAILHALVVSSGDPYAAEEQARAEGRSFPRPRELYRYASVAEYKQRPLYALPYPHAAASVLEWLREWRPALSSGTYAASLEAAIYDEAVRFDRGWRMRSADLLPIERDYAERKLARASALVAAGERYELLLALMELVEDAETLTVKGQPPYTLQLLVFRDHLRDVLKSPRYAEFTAGRAPWHTVLQAVSTDVLRDLEATYDFESLAPPRNLSHLENYLQRAEWQYYKSSARQEDFLALITYAQHDARYLRAVSRTSRKLHDPDVLNHNLPMVLLFREALRIEHGDKKKAVGLLDEAIRIPYAWIMSIPREALPASLALDNFLLPGNKEDGADKSRHWNVFGGICLYKSPQEAVDLALKREMQDLRDAHYSEEAMREFFRDMIGDLNGMYEVMSVNPDLLTLTHQP
jgi:hypothetical protein